MTTAMVRCTQPGCDGTIQDGCCTTCGLAAGRYFRVVWTVDESYVSAAFGLARARLAANDRPGAIAAPARLTPDEARRIELVDMATAIRPRTLT